MVDVKPKTNPHAEWVTKTELQKLITSHYGTRTLMFDRELAEAVLEHNTGNRRINKRKRTMLAQQMSDGQFENTGEPIIFSEEGILNNGQHRLLAVIDADAVIDLDVRFGIPRRMFTKTDTGTARTGGDVMTIRGVRHGSQISQAVRLLVLYERGLPKSVREFVSNDEINSAFERWQDIEQVVARTFQLNIPTAVRSTPLFATAYLASRSTGKSKLDAWLGTLATGLPDSELGRDDPSYQLRERLMRGIEAATREGLLERFALMIKSWNLYRKGETVPMREFRWRGTGKAAEPFPLVSGAKLG